jgi:hypothetical protein
MSKIKLTAIEKVSGLFAQEKSWVIFSGVNIRLEMNFNKNYLGGIKVLLM